MQEWKKKQMKFVKSATPYRKQHRKAAKRQNQQSMG